MLNYNYLYSLTTRTQKYSTFLITNDLEPMLFWLRHVGCRHSIHRHVADGVDDEGLQHSQKAAKWPLLMNACIAAAFVTCHRGVAGDVRLAEELLARCRHLITTGAAAQLHSERAPLTQVEPALLDLWTPGQFISNVLREAGGRSEAPAVWSAGSTVMPLSAARLPLTQREEHGSNSGDEGVWPTTDTSYQLAASDRSNAFDHTYGDFQADSHEHPGESEAGPTQPLGAPRASADYLATEEFYGA